MIKKNYEYNKNVSLTCFILFMQNIMLFYILLILG